MMLSKTISMLINGLHQNVNEYDLGDPYFQDVYRIYPFAREKLLSNQRKRQLKKNRLFQDIVKDMKVSPNKKIVVVT
jgi:hypothetical protein